MEPQDSLNYLSFIFSDGRRRRKKTVTSDEEEDDEDAPSPTQAILEGNTNYNRLLKRPRGISPAHSTKSEPSLKTKVVDNKSQFKSGWTKGNDTFFYDKSKMGEITALLKKQKKGDATPVISPNTYEVIDGFYCRSSYVNFLKPTADGRSSQAWSVPHVFFIKRHQQF